MSESPKDPDGGVGDRIEPPAVRPEEHAESQSLGNPAAVPEMGDLLGSHRDRLKRLVRHRLDPRLAARVDESDVVQDVMARACEHRSSLRQALGSPVAFFAWLREVARNRLVDIERQHVQAQRRSVNRERRLGPANGDRSSADYLAQSLLDSGQGPGSEVAHQEWLGVVRGALDELPPDDRQLLEWRHIQRLSVEEISDRLQVARSTVSARHLRAVERLQRALRRHMEG
ncbi:MAG: sigma-70 family RNA polymerase sigma factor [Pirellulales bacterium]